MRPAVYALLFGLGVLVWLVSMAAMLGCTWLERLARRVHPTATGGNCWVFALDKYRRDGGYLIVRASRSAALLGWPVPHVMWAAALPPDAEVEHFAPAPEDQRRARFFAWFAFWFRGQVYNRETKP